MDESLSYPAGHWWDHSLLTGLCNSWSSSGPEGMGDVSRWCVPLELRSWILRGPNRLCLQTRPPTVRIQLGTSEELNSPRARSAVRLPSSAKAVYLPLVTINKSHHHYFTAYTCRHFVLLHSLANCHVVSSYQLALANNAHNCIHPACPSCSWNVDNSNVMSFLALWGNCTMRAWALFGCFLDASSQWRVYFMSGLQDDRPLIWPIMIGLGLMGRTHWEPYRIGGTKDRMEDRDTCRATVAMGGGHFTNLFKHQQ